MCALAADKLHKRAAAADDIAVAHDREGAGNLAHVRVCRDEKLFRRELGCAVEIDRLDRLVGGDEQYFGYVAVERGLDDVAAPEDVGLYCLKRVVLDGLHALHRGRVYHDVDTLERALEPLLVAYVADEKTDAFVRYLGRHLRLLEFVAGKYDNLGDRRVFEQPRDKSPAEGAGPAGHEHGLALKKIR